MPAALCSRDSHTSWSQLPCPGLPPKPAETAARGLCSGSAWEGWSLGVKILRRIYLSFPSDCIASFPVRADGDRFRMVSFGPIVQSSGDGLLGSFSPGCFSPPFHFLPDSSSLNSAIEGMFERGAGWARAGTSCRWQSSQVTSAFSILPCSFLTPSHLPPTPVGNVSQAVENVLSVLLFYPEDEAAKRALNQYQTQLGEPRPDLGPREVIPSPTLTDR